MSELIVVRENESKDICVGGGLRKTKEIANSVASNQPDSGLKGRVKNRTPSTRSRIIQTKQLEPQIKQSSKSWATTERQNEEWGYWYQPDISKTSVRSESYLTSRVKIPNGTSPLLELVHFDFLQTNGRVDDVGSHKRGWLNRTCPDELKNRRFLIINIQVTAMSVMLVQYFIFKENGSTGCERVDKIWHEFVQGSDKARDKRLKLIPTIVKGNWLVRKSVPTKPCIIGTKVKNRYSKGANYFEIDIQTDASIIAKGVLSLLQGYTNYSVNLVWILEAVTHEELPERILAAMHLGYPNYKKAVSLEISSK